MIHIEKPENCCGCSACKSICPKDAISMEPDALGFLYPKVNLDKCIDCGLCEKVCAFNDHYDVSLNLSEPKAFGVRHKNMKEIESSRSGAAFIALSDWILDNGGVVYGAGYKDHFRVTHKRALTKQERDEFKGSKYVQSDMGNVFLQVRRDLDEGLLVLFSGTGCQVAGLNSFIGKKRRDQLYLLDIVCHGVPSPYIWRDYLNYLEKKEGMSITSVNFRDKGKFGWVGHKESFESNKVRIFADTYTYIFHQHIMLRQSCGVCYYANVKRPGDITIADFWGWEKTNSEFNKDNKGCSLVLCNTEKGCRLFELCKKDLYFFSAEIENCLQPNLLRPTIISKDRRKFERDYKWLGFRYVLYRYGNIGLVYKIQVVLKTMKKILKKIGRTIRKSDE
jgi:coenzyme F420-reducing hydrogenase beta subunit